MQGDTAKPDALSFRTAIDAMIGASSYSAAVLLCSEAHEAGIFSHYRLPQSPSDDWPARPLTGTPQYPRTSDVHAQIPAQVLKV